MVTFPDFPEAATEVTHDEGDGLDVVTDCLGEAIAGRMARAEDLPEPRGMDETVASVPVPLAIGLKAMVYMTLRKRGMRPADLAEAMQVDEKHVLQLLNPRHRTSIDLIQSALHALGQVPMLYMFGKDPTNGEPAEVIEFLAHARAK